MRESDKQSQAGPVLKDTAVTPSGRPGDGPMAGSGDPANPAKVWEEEEGRAAPLTDRPGTAGRVEGPGGTMGRDRSSQSAPYSEEAQADAIAKQGNNTGS